MSEPVVFLSPSAAHTRALAEALGRVCQGGEAIGLVGDLGAGKTCFVQGLAQGLDVPGEAYVNSPTFVLVVSHPGRLTLHHVDLYRLADPDEASLVGYDDLFEPDAVVAVEWFDRFPDLWPRSYLEVVLEEAPPSERAASPRLEGAPADPGVALSLDRPRRIRATPQGEAHADLLSRWRRAAAIEARRAAPSPPSLDHF